MYSKANMILISGLVLACLLSACSTEAPTPNAGAIQTAIAQTVAVNPTATLTPLPINTPEPTATATPTDTPEPTATAVPTDTPTPTPDLRVLDVDPQDYLLKQADLPKEAKYYLPNSSWISPHRNSEVVASFGVDEGRVYLEETGRVDGWWVYFNRGTRTVIAPEQIGDNPVLFRTAEGARLLLTKYSNCAEGENGLNPVETDLLIGDTTNVCMSREMQSTGENRVWFVIEFTYRNFSHSVKAWGWEDEVRLEYVETIARTLLAKLETAPLSDKVTFEP